MQQHQQQSQMKNFDAAPVLSSVMIGLFYSDVTALPSSNLADWRRPPLADCPVPASARQQRL